MTNSKAAPGRARTLASRRKAGGDGAEVRPRTLKVRSRRTDTTLQRHVSFFDDDGDRGVGVAECAHGLRALGMPIGLAEAAALAIVVPLSLQTRGSLLAMNVDIENVQQGKHDSDTGILDQRGRFDARRFEQVFGARATRDRHGKKAFTAIELTRMINDNRETLAGYVTAMAEWQLLLLLAADTEVDVAGLRMPALSVTRIKSFYDGTLFYKLARELA